jgi:hypothetical protein
MIDKTAWLERQLAATKAAKEVAEKKAKGRDKYLKRHNKETSQKK